jgi:predicted regulator of Ras-like GTPase activity (Roadblock/LC7/MglB family)
MTEVLHQMASVPGVVGSLVYGPGGEILASEFPDVFERSSLQEVASIFGEDTIIMKELTGENAFLDLRYAGGRVIVKPYAGGTFVVLCTSGINFQLLHLSMVQASRRLEKRGIEPKAEAPAAAAAVATARPAEVGGQMKAARERMKMAVIQELGPVGDIVFERAWAAWAAAAPPSRQGLGRLAETLSVEIDEPAARAQFLSTVRAIIA